MCQSCALILFIAGLSALAPALPSVFYLRCSLNLWLGRTAVSCWFTSALLPSQNPEGHCGGDQESESQRKSTQAGFRARIGSWGERRARRSTGCMNRFYFTARQVACSDLILKTLFGTNSMPTHWVTRTSLNNINISITLNFLSFLYGEYLMFLSSILRYVTYPLNSMLSEP